MNLNLDPGYMNIPGYYVIKNDKGEYLQIVETALTGSFPYSPSVRWTKRKSLRAQWRSADAANHQVVVMGLDDEGRPKVKWGWCVGLEAALRIMAAHGGHLVWVRLRAHRRHQEAA